MSRCRVRSFDVHLLRRQASAAGEAGVARQGWSDVESNELLLYMRRLEPAMLDSLSRPVDAAVDAAFDALIDGLLGSLVRLCQTFRQRPHWARSLWKHSRRKHLLPKLGHGH